MAILTNVDLVLRLPLFSGLTTEQAESVARAASKCGFKRGEVLVEQGQRSSLLGVLLSGRAQVIAKDARGREVILSTLHPGDFIGEMNLMDEQANSATVRAEVRTDVLLLDRSGLDQCLDANPSMGRALMKVLVEKLRCANRKIESLALINVSARVARVLLEAAVQDDQGEWVVRYKISRRTVAKMVGASREMVSRVVGELEEDGHIEIRDHGAIYVTALLGKSGNPRWLNGVDRASAGCERLDPKRYAGKADPRLGVTEQRPAH